MRIVLAFCLLAFGIITAGAQTPEGFNTFIGGLPPAGTPSTGDKLYILQGGSSKSISPTAIGDGAGVVNVTAYGAKCDGVTDDTTAIQAAVTAAGAVAVPPVGLKSISTIVFPGRCAISGTILVRNLVGIPSPAFVSIMQIRCEGAGAGLVWIGADNTGPMLQLGIPVGGIGVDNAFWVYGCVFGSATGSVANRPNAAISLQANEAIIEKNIFGWNHVAIQCPSPMQCLLEEIRSNSFGGCIENCIEFKALSNGSIMDHNEFGWCGKYCIESDAGDSNTISSNDFEGNVGGSLGSIYIPAGSAKINGNRFEDANTAGGVNFRSVTIGNGSSNGFGNFSQNSYGWNATYPGGPNYYIQINTAASASFNNEHVGTNPGSGSSGFLINMVSTSGAKWDGGYNCGPSAIFGGGGAFTAIVGNSSCLTNVNQANPTIFIGLPSSPAVGMFASITDGLAANCGDTTCTTFGTTVTAGGGGLKLLIWYNNANWTLIGK